MNTEEFVTEERRTDRAHRTARIAMMCSLTFLLSMVWSIYQCNVQTADEDARIEEAETRRVEAEQSTVQAREAAQAAVMPERDKLRYEAHEKCLQGQEQARCDELYFPGTRRKNLVQQLYRECLNTNIRDQDCDDEVEDLLRSHDRQ